MQNTNQKTIDRLYKIIKLLIGAIVFLILGILLIALFAIYPIDLTNHQEKIKQDILINQQVSTQWDVEQEAKIKLDSFWHPKDLSSIQDAALLKQVEYGKELIIHTSKYLGPNGIVMKISNGMNCQNCHIDAGAKIYGNNYGAVFATYPKYRARSGQIEDIYKRVNDCFERSLNGKALEQNSPEMQAIKAYIEDIGHDAKKGDKPKGSGIYELAYLDRAIDPINGEKLYALKCQSCHQAKGEGLLAKDQMEYIYPPLWGVNSYNIGAGLYRMSRFAGYIKYNMPQGVSYPDAQLSDEEAWDIAAFVNSQSRPTKDLSKDWPKISEKPIDHPFGPYSDKFTEAQHKFGPFKPIMAEKKKDKK